MKLSSRTILSLSTFIVTFIQAQTTVFNYTGAMQTYSVPLCATAITVDLRGAAGATIIDSAGKGGRVQATLAVTGGTVLYVFVGGAGIGPHGGGYNGGGDGANNTSNACGRGGGASDIRQGGYTLTDRIFVAGGGGGGGNDLAVNIGGDGGGLVGDPGVGVFGDPGTGGTQAIGGVGGCWIATCGQNGTLGNGGNGYNAGSNDGAGGGGGYYGGGGGGGAWGGGGGGSSYATLSATNVSHTTGYQAGNGQILITVATSSGTPPASPGPISGPAALCSGTQGTWSIAPVASAVNYFWTLPPGATIISGQGTTSIIASLGPSGGNIFVAAGNSCGASPQVSKPVSVLAPPPADAGSDTLICAGQAIILNATGGTSFLWNTGESTSSITVSPMATVTYYVDVSDANGCEARDEVVVNVKPAPVVDAGSDLGICPGGQTTLNGTGTGTLQWSPPNSLDNPAILNPVAFPLFTTTYFLTVTDMEGCTSTDSVTITVHPTPVAYAGEDQSICSGTSIQMNGSGDGSFIWSPSTGLSDTTIANPDASPSSTTSYTVTISNIYGCIAQDQVDITVLPSPVAGIVGNTAICPGESSILTASGGPPYTWSTGESSASITVSPDSTTTYQLTITLGGCSDKEEFTVAVAPPILADAGADVTICTAKSTQLQASGGTSYRWSPTQGLSDTTIANPVASPLTSTTYTARVIDVNNCQATDDVVVTVVPCIGIEDIDQSTLFTLSPNPSSGVFLIQFPPPGKDQINYQVFNALGQLVLERKITLQKVSFEVDIKHLPDGIYLLNLQVNEEMMSRRLIKR